jgi:hypothetical protein
MEQNVDVLRRGSRDSVFGIASGYRLDDREVGVRVPVGPIILYFATSFRPALGLTQPRIQSVPEGPFPGGKAAGA